MCDGRRERRLLVRLEAVRQAYDACLGESLKRLKLMREFAGIPGGAEAAEG